VINLNISAFSRYFGNLVSVSQSFSFLTLLVVKVPNLGIDLNSYVFINKYPLESEPKYHLLNLSPLLLGLVNKIIEKGSCGNV